MNELLQIFMPALIALFCTCWIYPYILKVAKIKNIVDNPDARKLQRIPIPVLGGFTVVFGILTGIMSANLFGNFNGIFPIFSAIIFILIVGLIDDIISLSPKVRFVIEIIQVLYLIYTTKCQLNDFLGLWGAGYDSQLHFHSPDHLRLRGYYQRHQSHRWCRWVFFGIQHRQLYPVRCNVLYAGQYQNGDTGRNCRFFALSILPA